MNTMEWALLDTKLVEQYLNTYIREREIDLGQCRHAGRYQYALPLSDDGVQVLFDIQHYSMTGYHRYHMPVAIHASGVTTELKDINVLLAHLCNALAQVSSIEASDEFFKKVTNSVRYCRHYVSEVAKQSQNTMQRDEFIQAEQGLLLGHPFHVTSKACQGFSDEDLARYSPELGAAFKLHYFALSPALLKQRVISNYKIPQDPIMLAQAKSLLGNRFDEYQLLPCHPWQANHLLEDEAVKAYLAEDEIISLGPMGETVWPTSSVRTVFAPKQGLFVKLALDVRITNFIRNNPPSHLERALDASEIIVDNQLDKGIERLRLLPELAYQTINNEALAASFAVLYRQGLSESMQAQTRILAALVEESPITGTMPLSDFIHAAAQAHNTTVNETFLSQWWYAYLDAALLPTLRLFASSGVSLEAHLQNALMYFENGWPSMLVVRDMEGCSVSIQRQPNLSPDSSASYSEDEAWFRYQYYVVVNHIAHVLSAVARNHAISEEALWSVTREFLTSVASDDIAKPQALALLNCATLPAKGNLLSTLHGCGESPVWINIDNPLRYQSGLSLSAQQQAEQRVVTQLIEALLYEKVLPYHWQNNKLILPLDEQTYYEVIARKTAHFERIRIDYSTLVRHHLGRSCGLSLAKMMTDLAKLELAPADVWSRFYDELHHTTQKHSQVLAAKPQTPLREMDYAHCEAKISNGHLYHPSFKSRLGFTLKDNANYGPELAKPMHLRWLAVDLQQVSANFANGHSAQSLARNHFNDGQLLQIETQLKAFGTTLEQVMLIPVHPWQWEHIGEIYFASRSGLYPLEIDGHRYLPQQSIRTLSDYSDVTALSVKLALSITNTSTSRVLAPHTIANAGMISDWLCSLLQDDQAWQQVTRPIILKEVAGVSVLSQPMLSAQYGALGCIWRESVYQYVQSPESVVPVTALMQLDIDDKPVIAPWVEQHGLTTWLSALVDHVYIPVMHMLWQHGVAMESHAQNMLLVHKQGLPVQAALKDFHDGVRFSVALLDKPELLPGLIESPAEHARVNPNSFLQTDCKDELRDFTQDALCFVNLAELGWFIEQHFAFSGEAFWDLVRSRIERYQSAHSQLSERFEMFDFFAPSIDVEQLACRRFMPEQRLRVMSVSNPLADAKLGADR
ncbi:IucA/IucC family protein [Pseudoalteromonas sp. T1lg23B]|uniref:IucA/IucC family protein n=1 Tax=Pseudoalteromonas sp. T1lg23B TaxID=2077097 RepID=UPI000CF667CF|nr:IucA/IucC family protein [Pseudoalteromonas sp. T1lg23B]